MIWSHFAGGENSPLTAGVDAGAAFTGAGGNDIFNAYLALDPVHGEATVETLTAFDALDGGNGTDTLNVRAVGDWTTPTTASVQNIEAADVRGDAAITINTATWTGLTSLTTSSVGGATNTNVTAAATTDVTAVITAQAGASINTTGGDDVTLTSTGRGTGAITVGFNTAAAGNVFISSTDVATGGAIEATAAGAITINQVGDIGGTITANNGTIITVTQTASTAGGLVTVNGGANTTAVSVSHAGAGTAADVDIIDGEAATDEADSITTVTLAAYGNATIQSGALTTVNLSGAGGALDINATVAGADQTATTLALNLNGLSGANTVSLDANGGDDSSYTTVNLASSTAASNLVDLAAGVGGTAQVTALNISGNAALTLGDQTALTTTAAITSTNTAGVTLSTALAVGQSFAGGDGADEVTIGATTEANSMGGGNDTVNLSVSALGTDGSIDGGQGTDTLVISADDAATASATTTFEATISGFETLQIDQVAAGATNTINMANLDNINHIISGGTVAAVTGTYEQIVVTISNLPSGGGDTFTFNGSTVTYTDASPTLNEMAGAISIGPYSDWTSFGYGSNMTSAFIYLTSNTIGNVADVTLADIGGTYAIDSVSVGSQGVNASAGGTLTITDMASGGTFELTGDNGGGVTINVTNAAAGASDVVNLTLNSAATLTGGTFTVADVETVNIASDDSNTTAHVNTLTLTAADTSTITVTGDAGLTLDHTGTALTSLDASVLGGDFTWTAGALAASSAITGSATGANTINLNSATTASTFVTYVGGSGDDVIDSTNDNNNVFTLGDGANSINTGGAAGNGNNTVTGGANVDTIRLGDGNNTISTQDGADVVQVGNGNNTVNVGDDDDQVTVGNGNNTVSLGEGDDTVLLGTGLNSVTLGAGADTANVNRTANANLYTTIADFMVVDTLDFDFGAVITAGTLGSAVTLAPTASFMDYLNTAAAGATDTIAWFQFGGNTFVVADDNAGATFTTGVNGDSVIALTGLLNLSGGDFSTTGVLTFGV